MRGWRWRREEADGGRPLEAGTGRCRAPTVAGSAGLTFCPCPPASRSEAAGDLGSVSVTQREARLWVSCWLWGAGPGSLLGVPGIGLGPGQVPRGLGRLSDTLPPALRVRRSCPPCPAHSPRGPKAPCPPPPATCPFLEGERAGLALRFPRPVPCWLPHIEPRASAGSLSQRLQHLQGPPASPQAHLDPLKGPGAPQRGSGEEIG